MLGTVVLIKNQYALMQDLLVLVVEVHLKFTNDSAVHEVPKLTKSKWVNEIILLDNHRHEALDEILRLLNERY